MLRLRLALGSALLLGAISTGCFSERLPPPTFRYACASDSECKGSEQCMSGLCQIPCTLATFDADCSPVEGNFITCFNGVCSSSCDVSNPVCSAPQECMGLDGVDLGGGGGGFIFGGGGDDLELGICAMSCEESGCPEGDVCLVGICAPTCDPAAATDTCPSPLVCAGGICLPDTGEGSTSDTTAGTTTDPTTTGAATTTDGTDGGTGGDTVTGGDTQ